MLPDLVRISTMIHWEPLQNPLSAPGRRYPRLSLVLKPVERSRPSDPQVATIELCLN